MLQPWNGSDGAKRKDRLEVKLQCLVCGGDVALAVAQEAVWSDWKTAYTAYGGQVCHRARALKSTDYGDRYDRCKSCALIAPVTPRLI